MMFRTTLLAAAPAAIAFASPAAAQVMTPADYVITANASDLFERQSAQTILETTQDPAVQSFAKMMLTAHAQSTAEVKAAAAKSRVPARPPVLNPLQQELMAELRAEPAATRDALYVAQQKAAHGQALSVQQAYAMGGTAPALKIAAGKIVPVVQSHIAMLMKM